MTSTDPRKMNRPSTRTDPGKLRGSRPSSFKPKLNSKYFGTHACSPASFRSQIPRSLRSSPISSRHTRSIAGASFSSYSFATRSSVRSSNRGGVGHAFERDRQLDSVIHRTEKFGLHLVKQASARQRIHAHERFGFVPRLQPMDRGKEELIRAGGKPLQRRERVRPLPQPVFRNGRARSPASP